MNELVSKSRIQHSVDLGLDFIRSKQLVTGQLPSLACANTSLSIECRPDVAPFVTALVVHSLSYSQAGKAIRIVQDGLVYLRAMMEPGGIWRYSRFNNDRSIPPDLDVISCISLELLRYGISFDSNRETLLANRNVRGVFLTWIRSLSDNLASLNWPEGVLDDVDCVVNANTVAYLGESEETKKAIDYLIALASNGLPDKFSYYYLDRESFYYMLSKAYSSGLESLSPAMEPITQDCEKLLRQIGDSISSLSLALIMCSFLNAGHCIDPSKHVDRLLESQTSDGSWPRSAFYRGPAYYGSEVLSTSFCIEALSRISK